MKVIQGLNLLGEIERPYCVTIGNFDGVHVGHRKIITELARRSQKYGGQSIVITFDPHPRKVLNPERPLQLMTSMEHRLELFRQLGVDGVVILKFDHEFSMIRAQSFIEKMLFPALKFRELIVGQNYVFGKDREGNIGLLEILSRKLNFKIDFVESAVVGGQLVSSSLIRRLISEGSLDQAADFLGRPFSSFGKVVKGDGIGSQLGFKTANIDTDGTLLPPRGVYAVEVVMKNEKLFGIANVGTRPTFDSRQSSEKLEVHLLNFDRKIYGDAMEVTFVEMVRDERRFESTESLRQQIQSDVDNVREKFLTA